MGHARALLGLANKRKQAEIAARRWRRRDVGARDRSAGAPNAAARRRHRATAARRGAAGRPERARLEQDLAEKLGAKVTIEHAASGKGKVVVTYNSLDELDGHPRPHSIVVPLSPFEV